MSETITTYAIRGGWQAGSDWTWSFNKNVFGDQDNYQNMLTYKNDTGKTQIITSCFLGLASGKGDFKDDNGNLIINNQPSYKVKVSAIYYRTSKNDTQIKVFTNTDNNGLIDNMTEQGSNYSYSGVKTKTFTFDSEITVEPNEIIYLLFDFSYAETNQHPLLVARNPNNPETYGGTVTILHSNVIKVAYNGAHRNAEVYLALNGAWHLAKPYVAHNSKWCETTA